MLHQINIQVLSTYISASYETGDSFQRDRSSVEALIRQIKLKVNLILELNATVKFVQT